MSRRRERASAMGLLPLMEARPWRDGVTVTYRYHPIGSKPVNLGTDRAAAIERVAQLSRSAPDSGTVRELWRLYRESPDWSQLAQATRTDYEQCSAALLRVFGAMVPSDIRALHVRRYLRKERAGAPVRANREVALLSNLLNVAIDIGDLEQNVCRNTRRNRERPRPVAPEKQTIARFAAWSQARGGQSAVLAGMAQFAALGGSRRIEFRTMIWSQVGPAVIRLQRAKQRAGDAPLWDVIDILPAMATLLARMRIISGGEPMGPVFPSARGRAYNERAFKSAWARLMTAARDESAGPPVLNRSVHFTFHDLRAHYATEHKRQTGRLPDMHADPGTTARIYDRETEVGRRSL